MAPRASVLACLLVTAAASLAPADKPVDIYALRNQVLKSQIVLDKIAKTCKVHQKVKSCEARAGDALFCRLLGRSHPELASQHCGPAKPSSFLQLSQQRAPEDELAKEMTHDLEMNFNKIAPFGKEDTAKELQDHAAKTQDTL